VPIYSPAFDGYSCYLPTEGWITLRRPGCLVLRRVGLPVQRRSPIQALTWLLTQISRSRYFQRQTSVSETIRKAPLAETQTTLRKQKVAYVLWNTGIYPVTEILWKNCFPSKISLKSSSRLLSYGQKSTFKTADVRHLEFFQCLYLVIWLSSSSKFAVVYQISSNSRDFSLRHGDFTIFKMADLRHL